MCAHTPVSPDLCKPNKALRTTLKAFLRTEEKKREKDRQATAPPTPPIPTPTESEQPAVAATEQKTSEVPSKETSEVLPPTETKPDEVATEAPPTETAADNAVDGGAPGSADALAEVRTVQTLSILWPGLTLCSQSQLAIRSPRRAVSKPTRIPPMEMHRTTTNRLLLPHKTSHSQPVPA